MKTFSKIKLGLIAFVILAASVLGMFPNLVPKAAAAAATIDNLESACVINISDNLSTAQQEENCKTDDSNCSAALTTYAGMSFKSLAGATYTAGTNTAALPNDNGGPGTLIYPTTVEVTTPSGTIPLGNSLLNFNSAANTKSEDDTTHIIYVVYSPSGVAAGGYQFLATFNSDGSMKMLGIVNTSIQTPSNNTFPPYICSGSINQAVAGVTGGISTPAAQAACSSYTGTAQQACLAGYSKQADGATDETTACATYTGTDLAACQAGFESSSATTAPSCQTNFTTGFEWVICPALDMADSAAGAFNAFVENQLCFNTGTTSSTAGGTTCDGGNNLNDGVKSAWSIFKNIATGLLVVVLIFMVAAQAFGGGPVDAYTFRKLLPKLLIAVIVLQLSWVLAKFAIDLSNDLGVGIRDLLEAPFGGGDNLQLDKLMGTTFSTHTTGTNDTFAFFSVIAIGTAAVVVSLPALALMALYVIMALATAFLVLIFRKLLIILLVIMIPVALVAWILPGTERYWKLWSSNFGKLLMMFPMIMGLIAAGRIFASITATNTTGYVPAGGVIHMHVALAHLGPLPVPTFGAVSAFVEIFIIVIAYFAPYFLLPKTYQWGGAAIGAVSKGASKGVEKLSSPAKNYLDWRNGLSPWKQARAARRAESERRIKLGFANRLQEQGDTHSVGGVVRGTRGRINRLRLGGVGMPGTEAQLRTRIVQSAEAEVEKNRREDIERANIQLTKRDLAQYHPDDHDAIRKAIILGQTITARRLDAQGRATAVQFNGAEYAAQHPQGHRAALDRGVVHGHMREIEEYGAQVMASGDQRAISEYQDFLQSNAAAIGDQMTHMLKGMNIAATSKPDSIVKMRQEEIESILGTLSSRIAAGGPGAVDAQRQLSVFLQNYATAATDNRLKTQLDQGGARAVKAFTSGNAAVINVINNDPADGRVNYAHLPPVEAAALASVAPALGAQITAINGAVGDDGVVH